MMKNKKSEDLKKKRYEKLMPIKVEIEKRRNKSTNKNVSLVVGDSL